jgi:methylenetetrahydrofolate dehydrogenase (NADP+)/methenyltetrahydrofolate cyclohydrolase
VSARILDGRALGRARNKALRQRVPQLERPPGLAVVLVGEDPASQVYVKRKGVVAERLGFVHRQITLPADTELSFLRDEVRRLNRDPSIDGILVQLPLPNGLDGRAVTECIDPDKDADGLTTASVGRLAQGRPKMRPCTPFGVMRLLEQGGIELSGKRACVLGRSNLVGRPMAMLLEQANATVTVCHSRTCDLPTIVADSDVVVAAVGQPEMVRGEWIRPGATVIDVGIHRRDDGSLVGDVAFDEAVQVAGAITPVPGGVGPMTIAMLMENTFRAAVWRQGASESLLPS